MSLVRAKKHLGQHFLTDKNIANKICSALVESNAVQDVLEVGPGMGILSDILFANSNFKTWLIDIDIESIDYLNKKYPQYSNRIISGDFLAFDFKQYFQTDLSIIGNFPYNISSQILFRVLEERLLVSQVVGMFQKEVAERVAAKPGNKTYGILSVLLQAYFTIEYLFTVNPGVFNPPPKVKSAVIRLTRTRTTIPDCDEKLFLMVVKAGFNQRRKTLRNALSAQLNEKSKFHPFLDLRAEALSSDQFIKLTNFISNSRL